MSNFVAVRQYIHGPGNDKRYPMAILIKIKLMMRLQSTTTSEHFLKFDEDMEV